jgi:hypothetical protein
LHTTGGTAQIKAQIKDSRNHARGDSVRSVMNSYHYNRVKLGHPSFSISTNRGFVKIAE